MPSQENVAVESVELSTEEQSWLTPELANSDLNAETMADWEIVEMLVPVHGNKHEGRRYPPPGGKIKVDQLTARGLITDGMANPATG